MKKVYSGFIGSDDYDFVTVGDSPIAELINDDIPNGQIVSVRYYITNEEVTEDQAVAALIQHTMGGPVESQYILDAYSEFTILEWEQELTVGGHSLLYEIERHTGKFITLIIE